VSDLHAMYRVCNPFDFEGKTLANTPACTYFTDLTNTGKRLVNIDFGGKDIGIGFHPKKNVSARPNSLFGNNFTTL
jgi:hypothetical protein